MEKASAPESEIEERSTLAVRLVRDNDCLWEALYLNEMMLRREPLTCMCHFEVAIDHHTSINITDKATARDIIRG